MQSTHEVFCEECGAANPGDATHCFACHLLLSHSPASLPAPPTIRPVTITPPPVLHVMAGEAEAPTQLRAGTLLQGRYLIQSEIGRGGYSVVYKAQDLTHHKRPVTIKQINLGNLTSRQAIEATETFNREKMLLPMLRHPGIPRYYGSFTDTDHWYLAMEYIPGLTLEEDLQKSGAKGYYSVYETLRIGIELTRMMDYLHWHKPPLIFRDLKPNNVMITRRKRLYLIDFGIARAFNARKTRDTTPLGSPGFAAPEQYGRGQSNVRTDVYGLGATLQALLTGRDQLELRTGEPSRAPFPVPLHVQALLDEMMNPDPARRPGNMALVRQRLQRALFRERDRFLYLLGMGIGLFFWLWYFCNANIWPLSDEMSAAGMWSHMLWPYLLVFTSIFMFSFLFMTSRRHIALGFLTVTLTWLTLAACSIAASWFSR